MPPLWYILIVVGILAIGAWIKWGLSEDFGVVRCRRCGHVGNTVGQFVPFKGVTPVCGKCRSEDWTKEPPPLP